MDDKNVEMRSYGVIDDSDRSNSNVDGGTATARGRRGGTARDEQEMAYFGKEQQLKASNYFSNVRNFGFWSIAGFVCTLLSTWEGLFAAFLYGFQNGGPAGLVYGFIFAWLGSLAVVASLAEMASMMPLSGGQYHWVSILAPGRWAKFMSYTTGWLTVIAWQAGQASVAFLAASIIQGMVILNHESYVPERWQGTLIFYALIFVIVFINTFLAKWLPKIEGLLLIFHILGFFAILIPLVYLAPHSSAKDVFVTFVNGGGWSSDGLSWFVGIVTSVFAFLGADSACHMSEEIHNASTVVPNVMMFSLLLNGVLGFAMLIAILFCLGSINDALATPTGFPFIEIFHQATNSKSGATVMTAIVMLLMAAASIGVMATASRMLWAFARDNGVPFSKHIGRVHEPTALPLYAILICTVTSLLLCLINIGSSAAFNAIVSITTASFFTSYAIPTALLLHKRLRNDPVKDNIHWGPWKMGPVLGPIVNVCALIYSAIAMFFSFWPSTANVTLQNMNWSALIWGGVIIFSMIFYVVRGKNNFKWPIVDPIRHNQ
ncbi:related to GABA transport protein [Rhynchosporium agropyri]|uniref:Related to GABA transport protein n=1 Tax=Rhynchosporium agropyri TaxID=914238 RepID=A0A1E1L368_9HELO|nr:related to GABA transport protein [Rhynchosporium agropyri]